MGRWSLWALPHCQPPRRRNASTSWRSPSTDGRLTRYGPSDLHQRASSPPSTSAKGTPVLVYLAPDALRVLRGGAQDLAVEEPDQLKVS